MAGSDRPAKMGDLIRQVIAKRLEKGRRDPRMGFVTITDVRVTGDLQHASDRVVLVQDLAHLLHHLGGALQGGAWRQLHDGQRVALVLLGQEAAGQAGVKETTQHGHRHEHDHPAWRMTHRTVDVPGIGLRDPGEHVVELAENDVLFLVVFRLPEAGAQVAFWRA